MPHNTSTSRQPAATDRWKTTLSRGDVIRFRFPVRKRQPDDTGPKLRPCLVLEVFTWGHKRFAKIAYGTSANTRANRGYEIRVRHPAAIRKAGLNRPSRFVCARTVIVSLDNPGFEALRKGSTPVAGRLEDRLMEALDRVQARLDADADTAANARAEKCRNRRAWRPEGGGFRKRNRALRSTNPSPIKEFNHE